MATEVIQDASMNRFELLVDGQSVGELDYSIRDDTIVLIHTEIDPSQREGGMGGELVKGALNLIRAETDYRVVANCTFASAWVSEHPEYEDLLTR
jgi:predicted GNAT family acetyltransferase